MRPPQTRRSQPAGPGEVGELASAFDEMVGRIDQLLRRERELLANISHELRTPMARIRVALELAAEADPAKARAHLEAWREISPSWSGWSTTC